MTVEAGAKELLQRDEGLATAARFSVQPGLRVGVVIPTLNEARNLEHVLPKIPAWVDEIVIVDGRSTDDTVAEALRLRPDARIVLESRPGKGRALLTGFAACSCDLIVTFDADGSMDPGEIPSFVLTLLLGADFAKGSRFLQGGGTFDMGLLRRAGNRGLTGAVRLAFGARFTDLCYGYNAFWADVLPFLEGEAGGFEIETHMNLRALGHGLRVVEVPSYERRRVYGVSNLRTFRDGFRVLRTILRERANLRGLEAIEIAGLSDLDGLSNPADLAGLSALTPVIA